MIVWGKIMISDIDLVIIKKEIEKEIIENLHFDFNYSFKYGLTTVKKLQLKYKDKILSEKEIK